MNLDIVNNFTTKEKLYFKIVDDYFRNSDISDIQKMVNIINGTSNISLRLLDNFVEYYTKGNNTYYFILGNNYPFYVNTNYKIQLKCYTKKYFDPFRRFNRFYYYYDPTDNTKRIDTTIGQLNFFKWCFTNNVIKYIEDNYNKII